MQMGWGSTRLKLFDLRRETRRNRRGDSPRSAGRQLGKTAGVGHYVGKVQIGSLRGYLWLLGGRLYLKLGWRPRDTYFLGNLSDPLSLAARLRRLMPRPVDVRRVAAALARALAAALYVARRCRDSPRWKIRTWRRRYWTPRLHWPGHGQRRIRR
jgi:hypothetical protein